MNRRYSLSPVNCSGCSSDTLSCSDAAVLSSPCLCASAHISMAVSQTHLNTFEKQPPPKEEVAKGRPINPRNVTVRCPRSDGGSPSAPSFPRGLRACGCGQAAVLAQERGGRAAVSLQGPAAAGRVPGSIPPVPPAGSAGVTRGPHAPAPRRSCPCRRGSASRWAPPRSRRTPGT